MFKPQAAHIHGGPGFRPCITKQWWAAWPAVVSWIVRNYDTFEMEYWEYHHQGGVRYIAVLKNPKLSDNITTNMSVRPLDDQSHPEAAE